MVLLLEIGNTTLGVAMLRDGQVVRLGSLPTYPTASVAHYGEALAKFLASQERPEAGVLSSVVPALTPIVREAMQQEVQGEVHVVSRQDIERVLPIAVEQPEAVGRDRLLDCVGALTLVQAPSIVIDMGTATTVNVVDAQGRFAGGMIMAGVETAVQALSVRAAKLPPIPLQAPSHLIGQNTVECMQSGAIVGHAAMIDGLIGRLHAEMHVKCPVVVTGGWSSSVLPYIEHDTIQQPQLQFMGMAKLFNLLTA